MSNVIKLRLGKSKPKPEESDATMPLNFFPHGGVLYSSEQEDCAMMFKRTKIDRANKGFVRVDFDGFMYMTEEAYARLSDKQCRGWAVEGNTLFDPTVKKPKTET